MSFLDFDGVTVSFGATRALDGCSLALGERAFGVVLGPSGCGKTTLLRAIAGLETPSMGRIALAGHDLAGVPPEKRGVGFVFQDGVLFPHLDVFENVAFALRVARVPRNEVERRVGEVLSLVGLAALGGRRVDGLSGGERQRVALARALAPAPCLLLLDEPFAALDRALREELRRAVRKLHDETGVTTLFVTHDQEEALALADRLFVMDRGRVVEDGTPEALLARPRTAFAARFLGLPVVKDATGELLAERVRIVASGKGRIEGRVVELRRTRGGLRAVVEVEGGEITLDAPVGLALGERVGVEYDDAASRRLT